MAIKKFSLLRNSSENIPKEPVDEKRSDYPIIDTQVIEFVVIEFPSVAKEITLSLQNLMETLEKSIDFIEDTSSEIIKNQRNFKLSEKYRENSIRLHEISLSIAKYTKWMENNCDNSFNSKANNSNPPPIITDNTITPLSTINICNDFTNINPKSFLLDNFNIAVDDWNDLIIKTANILTQNYKTDNSETLPLPILQKKKSIENDFRDTIIEMLSDYKINFERYSISPH